MRLSAVRGVLPLSLRSQRSSLPTALRHYSGSEGQAAPAYVEALEEFLERKIRGDKLGFRWCVNRSAMAPLETDWKRHYERPLLSVLCTSPGPSQRLVQLDVEARELHFVEQFWRVDDVKFFYAAWQKHLEEHLGLSEEEARRARALTNHHYARTPYHYVPMSARDDAYWHVVSQNEGLHMRKVKVPREWLLRFKALDWPTPFVLPELQEAGEPLFHKWYATSEVAQTARNVEGLFNEMSRRYEKTGRVSHVDYLLDEYHLPEQYVHPYIKLRDAVMLNMLDRWSDISDELDSLDVELYTQMRRKMVHEGAQAAVRDVLGSDAQFDPEWVAPLDLKEFMCFADNDLAQRLGMWSEPGTINLNYFEGLKSSYDTVFKSDFVKEAIEGEFATEEEQREAEDETDDIRQIYARYIATEEAKNSVADLDAQEEEGGPVDLERAIERERRLRTVDNRKKVLTQEYKDEFGNVIDPEMVLMDDPQERWRFRGSNHPEDTELVDQGVMEDAYFKEAIASKKFIGFGLGEVSDQLEEEEDEEEDGEYEDGAYDYYEEEEEEDDDEDEDEDSYDGEWEEDGVEWDGGSGDQTDYGKRDAEEDREK